MSFRCDRCHRQQKEPARPIRVVTARHEDGQIKREEALCSICAEEATPAPLPERRPPIVETMTLAFPDLSDVLGWVN